LVCVTEREDVDRWAALGIERKRIHCTGSIKYDLSGLENRLEIQGIGIFHPNPLDSKNLVLFGGSTHPGEEEILAQVFLKLRKQFPSLSLLIASRHVEWGRVIPCHVP